MCVYVCAAGRTMGGTMEREGGKSHRMREKGGRRQGGGICIRNNISGAECVGSVGCKSLHSTCYRAVEVGWWRMSQDDRCYVGNAVCVDSVDVR